MFSTVKMPKCLRHHMNLITVDPMFYVSRLMVWLPRTEKCRQAQARPAENMNGYIVLLTCTNFKKKGKKQLHCPCNSRIMNINIMNIFFNLHAPFFKIKSLACIAREIIYIYLVLGINSLITSLFTIVVYIFVLCIFYVNSNVFLSLSHLFFR